MICRGVLLPAIDTREADPEPKSEQVLPLSVIPESQRNLRTVILQANGCYEHQWYDACAVMIRRFVESLIIGVYEHHNKAAEIKENGDFVMLARLVDRVMGETQAWNLGRESKRNLPLIKSLGDRSAHNRRYLATKSDVDKVKDGLRVIADELLHLAGFK